MLQNCNLFIHIYKTAAERIQSHTDLRDKICVILNSQMRLLLEIGADKRQSNLPTANEVAIIIPNKYSQKKFCNIVLACQNPENNGNPYYIISFNLATYIPLYYILFFS